MKFANVNFFRTIMGLFGGGAILATVNKLFFQCTGDDPTTIAVEAAKCGAEWIPVEYQALAGLVFVVIGGLAKTFFKSGTVGENLASPSVPVVKVADARPGVVTPTQVESAK